MELRRALGIMRRHLTVTAVTLSVAVLATVATWNMVTPGYEGVAKALIIQPERNGDGVLTPQFGNPYRGAGVGSAAGVMAEIAVGDEVRSRVLELGGDAPYVVAAGFQAPTVVITASGSSAASTARTARAVVKVLAEDLEARQAEIGVPPDIRLQLDVLSQPGDVRVLNKTRTRLSGAVLVAGILLAYGLARLLDGRRETALEWVPRDEGDMGDDADDLWEEELALPRPPAALLPAPPPLAERTTVEDAPEVAAGPGHGGIAMPPAATALPFAAADLGASLADDWRRRDDDHDAAAETTTADAVAGVPASNGAGRFVWPGGESVNGVSAQPPAPRTDAVVHEAPPVQVAPVHEAPPPHEAPVQAPPPDEPLVAQEPAAGDSPVMDETWSPQDPALVPGDEIDVAPAHAVASTGAAATVSAEAPPSSDDEDIEPGDHGPAADESRHRMAHPSVRALLDAAGPRPGR